MAKLNNWRVLKDLDGMAFLAGICQGHPTVEDGPIVTNIVNEEDCKEGARVVSKSGTEYHLQSPMSEDKYPEFAFPLLMKRALDSAYKDGVSFSEKDLQDLGEVVDMVVKGTVFKGHLQ